MRNDYKIWLNKEPCYPLSVLQMGEFVEFISFPRKFILSLSRLLFNTVYRKFMKILSKIVSMATAVVALVACGGDVDESTTMQPSAGVEVEFSMSMDATRTTLDPDGMTTRWAVGDKLAVWAKDAQGNYSVEAATFSLRYFSTEYNKAYFTSTIAPMAEGDYTYLLSYPLPASTNGSMVTYNLPAEQTGNYDGRYDVMLAEPVVNGALTGAGSVELNTIMRHQMHALKITVPEKSSNFANKVYSLEVTFPNAVVGDMTLDVSNPDAAPTYSKTSNTIIVNSAEGFDVGSDIWVFVLPGQVSGDVSYRVHSIDQRSVVKSYPLERNMQRGHVTPIRMSMPEYDKYTVLNFSVGQNYLGEEFNYFTLYDNTGKNMGTFNRNSENRYSIAYEGDFDASKFSNTTWTMVFDSDNAVVENSVNLGTVKPYFQQNISPVDVPYLLFQDFESVSEAESYGNNSYASEDRDQPGNALSGVLSGWNAARFWLKPGAMRLNARRQCVKILVAFASNHHGRLDTPQLGGSRGIKPGKSVNVNLQFDAAMNRHSSSSLTVTQAGISVATHTNANNPIDGIPTGTKGLGSSYNTTLADYGNTWRDFGLSETAGSDDFGKTFPTYSTELAVSSTTRICFYPTISCEDSGVGNSEINVYLDNIKVSIAKE